MKNQSKQVIPSTVRSILFSSGYSKTTLKARKFWDLLSELFDLPPFDDVLEALKTGNEYKDIPNRNRCEIKLDWGYITVYQRCLGQYTAINIHVLHKDFRSKDEEIQPNTIREILRRIGKGMGRVRYKVTASVPLENREQLQIYVARIEPWEWET